MISSLFDVFFHFKFWSFTLPETPAPSVNYFGAINSSLIINQIYILIWNSKKTVSITSLLVCYSDDNDDESRGCVVSRWGGEDRLRERDSWLSSTTTASQVIWSLFLSSLLINNSKYLFDNIYYEENRTENLVSLHNIVGAWGWF